MKEDVGMSPHEKEGEQEDAHTKTETLCLLFVCINILLVRKVSVVPTVISDRR